MKIPERATINGIPVKITVESEKVVVHVGAQSYTLDIDVKSASLTDLHKALVTLPIQRQGCTHPNAAYQGEETGTDCKGRRHYVRERWECPDCGHSWFEAVRWID